MDSAVESREEPAVVVDADFIGRPADSSSSFIIECGWMRDSAMAAVRGGVGIAAVGWPSLVKVR